MRLLHWLLPLAMITSSVFAEEEEAKPEPLDPAYEGTFNLVLMNYGSHLLAYVMHQDTPPHDLQLAYKISTDSHVTFFIRDADFVTATTAQFNIQRLMRGEEGVKTTMTVFAGDVTEGASSMYEDVNLSFDSLVYFRPLAERAKASRIHQYDEAPLRGTNRLLIHQMTERPSFDHLVIAYDDVRCMLRVITRDATPSQNELLTRLSVCGSLKPVYFKRHD